VTYFLFVIVMMAAGIDGIVKFVRYLHRRWTERLRWKDDRW